MKRLRSVGLMLGAFWALPTWAQVKIEDPWARATVPGQKATGVFMKLTASQASQLVGVSSPLAGVAEVHEMKMENNVMKMAAVTAIDLPAGKPVALQPGGYHVMLMGLKEPLPVDSHVELTLLFEDAKGVKSQQELHVMTMRNAPGAQGKPADAHHNH